MKYHPPEKPDPQYPPEVQHLAPTRVEFDNGAVVDVRGIDWDRNDPVFADYVKRLQDMPLAPPVPIPSRNPDPYTSAMFRAEYPNLTPGQICPSCEDEDSSIADDGVCYLCVCGCSYCEPDDG
ncbi:hypothetical protein SEA_EYRE_63 [Gordonia phage Eyre]|uniref:Uncharacterized protein n=1 Tax=Gordonia phage Eyre TaxID=1887646 RepID=A0A1B3B015_9CAUD|nr:hypothetical protein BIZ73_gp63 [Gordonia phage Eyre]AOE44343.1 hypothetical protein SEA_EYRE_63 [Gordonia phage Eyre]